MTKRRPISHPLITKQHGQAKTKLIKRQNKAETIEPMNFDDEKKGLDTPATTIPQNMSEPPQPINSEMQPTGAKLIIILEACPLYAAHIGKQLTLINGEEHRNYIQKHLGADWADIRPDILHQSLLILTDSPLNKSGHLQIYVRTKQGVLIWISPNTRIPRTYSRFQALMAQLLTKLKIRAADTSQLLLKTIKNPITSHLPFNSTITALSTKGRPVKLKEYIRTQPADETQVYVVGGVSRGNPTMEVDYINESIAISAFPLSAAYCLGMITTAYEELWGIN